MGTSGAEVVKLWRTGAVVINEKPAAFTADCREGGPHSRVEAGTCTKCGEEGEALT